MFLDLLTYVGCPFSSSLLLFMFSPAPFPTLSPVNNVYFFYLWGFLLISGVLLSNCCFSVAELCWLFVTPWTAACQASPSFTLSWNLLNSCPLSQWCHQPSHPLLSPSPTAFNLSQHQGLFQWVSSSHQVAKVLGVSASALVLQINIQDWFPLGLTGWISLPPKELSRVFSTVLKHEFFSAQLSLGSNSNIHTWLLEKP